jgi:hypothetical protein
MGGTAGMNAGNGGSSGTAVGGGPAGVGGSTAGDTASGGATSGTAGASVGGEAGEGMQPGQGGAPAAGSSGSAGVAGSGGMDGGMPPLGSPGCALANPVVPTRLDNDVVELRLLPPAVYDGVTPVPLLVMFHATNQTSDYAQLTTNQPGAARYMIAVPRNSNPGYFEEEPTSDYDALLEQILGAVCIDERAVFGVGNGSGGRFLTKWLQARSGNGTMPPFRAGAMVGTAIRPRLGTPLPFIFIHAQNSSNSAAVAQDADGLKALASFLASEQCGDTTTPVDTEDCGQTTQIHAGCVDYEGCAAPFRFCHHDGSGSGGDVWPCVASPAIYQFFEPFLPDPG